MSTAWPPPGDDTVTRGRHTGALTVVSQLDPGDLPELWRLIDADPVVNCVLAARLESVGGLDRRRLGSRLLGVRDADGVLAAVALHGGNLLAVGGGPAEWTTLGRHLAGTPRACTSIIGRDEAVAALWRAVEPVWGPARVIRAPQPLLVGDRQAMLTDAAGPSEHRVRPIRLEEFDAYLPAAVAMFTEELGLEPVGWTRDGEYRSRLTSLVRQRRAWGIVTRGPAGRQVLFKADIAAVSSRSAQIQGVWVRPDLRGQGLATAALRPVLQHALSLAPTVSLYVNDFNSPARRLYRTLGLREVANLATVLF